MNACASEDSVMIKTARFCFFFAFIFAISLAFPDDQSALADSSRKSRVAVFGFINLTGDSAFDVPAETAGNTLYMSLRMIGIYDVSMPDSIPRNLGEESLARWCTANGIDTVLFGTVSSSDKGQEYGLSAFSSAKKSLTVRKTAKGSSVLDVFGISDVLIQSMLDSITGRHVGFGILEFRNTGIPGTYAASIDGLDLGMNPSVVDHVTSGMHRLTITQVAGSSRAEVASLSVMVTEGKKATVSFELKDMGTAGSKDAAREPVSRARRIVAKGDSLEFAQHLSSLNGKYTQATGKKSGFVHKLSPFSIGKREITYGQWFEVYQWATSPERGPAVYAFGTVERYGWEGDSDQASSAETANKPMTGVSWRDAIVWCNARSEMEGLEPVYYTDEKFAEPLRSSRASRTKILEDRGSVDNPYVNAVSKGYRLPTSGEWQFAASCGGLYPYDHASGADLPFDVTMTGDVEVDIDIDGDGVFRTSEDVAWFSTNSGLTIHGVGEKASNRWGLYDMSGNAWEWTFDWEGMLPQISQTDYTGPKSGKHRIIRGGACFFGGFDIRIASYGQSSPYDESPYTGFRVCRSE